MKDGVEGSSRHGRAYLHITVARIHILTYTYTYTYAYAYVHTAVWLLKCSHTTSHTITSLSHPPAQHHTSSHILSIKAPIHVSQSLEITHHDVSSLALGLPQVHSLLTRVCPTSTSAAAL